MKKKIKLRDLTKEQYQKYMDDICPNIRCSSCPFGKVECLNIDTRWIEHKDLYSDKFLNQEIEIEVPELLDKKEKEYLEAVLKPFKDRVIYVKKGETWDDEFIRIATNDLKNKGYECIDFPVFKKGTMYKGLEIDKTYTLKDLGLFQNEKKKCQITIKEFWNHKDELAINLKTQEEKDIFSKASDKLGHKWVGGVRYTELTNWTRPVEETCYTNRGLYDSLQRLNRLGVPVYNFEDVDFNN